MEPRIYQQEIDYVRRLHELGLSLEGLKQAVDAGEVARASCSRNHPKNAPGFLAWAECVAMLREVYLPNGFVAEDLDGLPLLANHGLGIAIAVATGDVGTGHSDREVRTKYHKGHASKTVVDTNEQQLELALDTAPSFGGAIHAHRTDALLTFYLLRRRKNNRIFWELSLPTRAESTGDEEARYRIIGWAERIILPSYDVLPELEIEEDMDDVAEEVEIDIQRR